MPEDWAPDEARCAAARVPESIAFATKGDIALSQIDAALAEDMRFGGVLADAVYGSSAGFRAGLSARGLRWAVGMLPTHKVYPADVRLEVASVVARRARAGVAPCPPAGLHANGFLPLRGLIVSTASGSALSASSALTVASMTTLSCLASASPRWSLVSAPASGRRYLPLV